MNLLGEADSVEAGAIDEIVRASAVQEEGESLSTASCFEARKLSCGNERDKSLIPGFLRFNTFDLCKGEVVDQHPVLGGHERRYNEAESEVFEGPN